MTESVYSSSKPLIVQKKASCTFEASSTWRKILRQFPLKERCLEGNGFCLFYWEHFLSGRAISSPFRDRLALEWDGSTPPSNFEFQTLVARIKSNDLVLKDVGFLLSKLPKYLPEIVCNYINCEVILDGNIENRLKRSARKNFRKACQGYGLKIVVNPDGIFEDFYDMYLTTRKRLGVLPYSKNFFRALFDFRSESVVVFACNSSQGFLGYLICYLHGQEMISGHLTYVFEEREKRISDFLFISAFNWGRSHGFSTYRFGADNCNQVSLIKSKEKLGGTPRAQWDFSLKQKSISENHPNSPIRRVLRATPKSIFRHMGCLTSLYHS